ncbi:hypothetical protein ACHHYP_06394 [Achlya hypogyna]|uniref:Transcriptional regulator n=1 Tax=Achlya hypogyna TaxID=1202772 RepID=A0A1V9YTW5_ACHHY|nr:hypothetical protein ACHHYP_06394 [Achlya hypogyna]
MYTPSAFREIGTERIHEVLAKHPFATLVLPRGIDESPFVSHIPLLHDTASNELRGHVAKVNAIGRLEGNTSALAIFHGPNAYVSPSWYETKRVSGKVVPTWNYVVVHVHGKLTIVHDPNWILDNVSQLSDAHEKGMATPWAVTDAPDEYITQLRRSIVGIKLTISSMEAQFKLSQNKHSGDFFGVLNGMRSTPGGDGIADWMVRVQDEIRK